MNLGPQELVWIVVGLLALYVVMQLGRLQGLRRARRGASGGDPAPAAPPASAFGMELEVQQLRREVTLLREELENAGAAWAESAARLEAELLHLRDGVEGMQAERSVSPHYGEALVLARRGLAAETIAERCGISVAEAALVCSLAQGGEQPPENRA
jgi:uncharacterized protein DUF2802